MIDPERICEERQTARRPRLALVRDDATPPVVVSAQHGRRWLARWRGDCRTFAEIAAEDGASEHAVRCGIDAALRLTGSSLAEAEAARARRLPAWLCSESQPQPVEPRT